MDDVNSIGIVLLISFFIGAVITIQIKLNIESPWMPRWTVGYVTREILLLEFSSSIMCLILAVLKKLFSANRIIFLRQRIFFSYVNWH